MNLDETHPFVSIIIPVYNDLKRLGFCLDALNNQTYPQERYEIIVVDNGSTPPVASQLTAAGNVVVVTEAKPGSFAARNTGAQAAQGAILAFTDSDCIPSPTWVERGAFRLQANKSLGLIGGRVDVFAQDNQNLTSAELYDVVTAFPQQKYVETMHFSVTANMFTFKAVFDTVGPFNEQIKSGGDLEWGQRVYAHGYQQLYADDVVIRHPARENFAQIRKKAKRIAGGFYDKKKESRSFAKLVLGTIWAFAPPVKAWQEALANMTDGYSLWAKCKVSYLVFIINYTMAFERVRLALGGSSEKV